MSVPLLGSALRDDNGLGDIAYISLAVVTALLLFAALNIVALVWVDWATCVPRVIMPTAEAPNIQLTLISCKPDVLVLGQAFGLAAGAFSTALLALAAYMAATRRPQGASTTTTTTKQETVVAAAPIQPQDKPLEVAVVDQAKPIEVKEVHDAPKTEANPPKRARGNKTKH